MKLVIVALFAVVAVAVAAPQNKPAAEIKILRSAFDQQPDGPYTFNFETEDGVLREETGELKLVTDEDNKQQNVVVVRGSYSYPGEDGKPIVINYFADETGYHAEGDSIPKAQR